MFSVKASILFASKVYIVFSRGEAVNPSITCMYNLMRENTS